MCKFITHPYKYYVISNLKYIEISYLVNIALFKKTKQNIYYVCFLHTNEMEKCLVNLPKVLEEGGRCDIFECLFGLKPIHVRIYFYTLKKKRTIKEIASHVNRDRTTTVRLVQKIIKQGLLEKETIVLAQGGLKNEYLGIEQEIVKERLGSVLGELETAMKNLFEQDWLKIPY